MSDRYGARGLARALRNHSKSHVRAQVRNTRFAVVLDTNPLSAELTDSMEVLDDDDLVLSQWVRKYDADHEIDPGDTLVVQLMGNGDYLVTDVVSEKDMV